MSLKSLALAGGFFTTSTTWEAPLCSVNLTFGTFLGFYMCSPTLYLKEELHILKFVLGLCQCVFEKFPSLIQFLIHKV